MRKFLLGFLKNNIKGLISKKNKVSLISMVNSTCKISNMVVIDRGCKLNNVEVKEYSYIAKYSEINNCKIGKFCSIAPHVKIGFGNHPTNYLSTSPLFYAKNNKFKFTFNIDENYQEFGETIIGNDVWIGVNSIIMDGIKIGDGAIIGAGAVVTKDVEPYSIVGGVPAKIIKYRFSEENISALLKIKWWNKSSKELLELNNKIYVIDQFLNEETKKGDTTIEKSI